MNNQPTSQMKLTWIILAGGQGRRMGYKNKGLELHHNRPLIHWVLHPLKVLGRQTFISANADLDIYRSLSPTFTDHFTEQIGPLAGIVSAFEESSNDWLGFLACDTPVNTHSIIERIEASVRSEFDAVLCRVNGKENPLMGAYHRRCVEKIHRQISDNNYRVTSIVAKLSVFWIEINDERLVNINYPDQLA